jgi:hypothetical protein
MMISVATVGAAMWHYSTFNLATDYRPPRKTVWISGREHAAAISLLSNCSNESLFLRPTRRIRIVTYERLSPQLGWESSRESAMSIARSGEFRGEEPLCNGHPGE